MKPMVSPRNYVITLNKYIYRSFIIIIKLWSYLSSYLCKIKTSTKIVITKPVAVVWILDKNGTVLQITSLSVCKYYSNVTDRCHVRSTQKLGYQRKYGAARLDIFFANITLMLDTIWWFKCIYRAESIDASSFTTDTIGTTRDSAKSRWYDIWRFKWIFYGSLQTQLFLRNLCW